MAKRRKDTPSETTTGAKREPIPVKIESKATPVICISDTSDDDCFVEASIFKRVVRPKIANKVKFEPEPAKLENSTEFCS
ncbi:hypothetical protein DSO57_1002423 [Entomophthora muscae]|uniref:Uncharacterized protein n=1 Tax=Entomophthora muscae TaxID=34485 RepID=A0ACC2SAX8_9FUNG|nr:hypothetical protein DSO57_1002423 [Entomophthora muscae]